MISLKSVIYCLTLAASLSLGACTDVSAAQPSEADIQNPQVNNDRSSAEFTNLLVEYQILNHRLDRISTRLKFANAELCPVTVRDPGYTVHTLTDYPENLQAIAGAMLNVDEAISVRTVREPSDISPLPGDRILKIDDTALPDGITQKNFYEMAAREAFAAPALSLIVVRGDEIIRVAVNPKTVCGYPVHLFSSQTVNGHTDGQAVWISAGLLRAFEDDIDVAHITAHEMAHTIAGHMAMKPHKDLELMADRMALIMLARAGFDIDRAVENWENRDHPHQAGSLTHPPIEARQSNLRSMRDKIKAAQKESRLLDFDLANF